MKLGRYPAFVHRNAQRRFSLLPLSDKWVSVLNSQPETGMGYQIASVFLVDGRRFDGVAIVGGFVTKIGDDSAIPFKEEQIAKIVVTG
jgi:hypothetical protein